MYMPSALKRSTDDGLWEGPEERWLGHDIASGSKSAPEPCNKYEAEALLAGWKTRHRSGEVTDL